MRIVSKDSLPTRAGNGDGHVRVAPTNATFDLRDDIFRSIAHKVVVAGLFSDQQGLLVGIPDLTAAANELNLTFLTLIDDVSTVQPGQLIATFQGVPKDIARAEERFVGVLAKSSGIATATRKFVEAAGTDMRIVSGAWRKMPISQKQMIRNAIRAGGADFRISRGKFVYLDKNFVRMLGGIKNALLAVKDLKDHEKVIQIKQHYHSIESEAIEATDNGAAVIFVDTGEKTHVTRVSQALQQRGLRERVAIAFAGNVRLEDIAELRQLDIDRLDVGRCIVDAPLLDIKVDVLSVDGEQV